MKRPRHWQTGADAFSNLLIYPGNIANIRHAQDIGWFPSFDITYHGVW